jgi:two-component system, OmpR family, sensor histidine kinase CreC
MRATRWALLAVVVIVALGFALLADSQSRNIEHENFQATEEVLIDMANVLAALLETQLQAGVPDASLLRRAYPRALERTFNAQIFDLAKTKVSVHAYLTDGRGIVLYDSDGGASEGLDYSQRLDVYRTLRGEYGARSSRSVKEDASTSVLHIAAPVRDGERIVGVLTLRKPKLDQWFFVQQRRHKVQLSSLLIGAGIALFIGLIIYRVLEPLRALTRYVQAIKRGERAPLPDLRASSDVRDLAVAVDEMRDELEGRDYAATFAQTLTHELKSPLAAIRATAELMAEPSMIPADRERFAASLKAETERSEHLIRQLLRLAEVERQKTLQTKAPVPLHDLVQQAIAELQPAADAKCLDIAPALEACTVIGDASLLRRAVLNLLENAIDFSPATRTIHLRLAVSDRDAHLQIDDAGPGIPDYALPRLFERFYSLKHQHTGRKGSGLGLCFAKEAIHLHHGMLTLTNREGGGARAEMTLPMATSQARSL